MKNILEFFLDALDVRYTSNFANSLYNEHPHKGNMFGLKKMLDVYGVKSVGVRIDTKELTRLNYPCILHIHGDFVIGLHCDEDALTYLQKEKKTTISHDVFNRMWTGNALVVEKTTDAVEPSYKQHKMDERISAVKAYGIPILLAIAVGVGVVSNLHSFGVLDFVRMALSVAGILVCTMLMEKQLFGESRYGDKVCSLFHYADCNSVLDGPMAKVFGISWSEVGLGYFTANLMLLSLFPESYFFVAVINWAAMTYGIWSVYYQWRIAQNWCVLCVLVQILVWTMGVAALVSCQKVPITYQFNIVLLAGIVFAISILMVHQYAQYHASEQERVRAVQEYRSLKANSMVGKTLIEQGEFYEVTHDDSSIIFGNPQAKLCVTILSNPHCNPCARMHKQVKELLNVSGNDICIQYIFSAFNKPLEDSSRYLIACYQNHPMNESLCLFDQWYTKDKYDYQRIIKQNAAQIHAESVEEQVSMHERWRQKVALTATPTVLVNGYKLPHEYKLADLAMMTRLSIE